jgi:hypothetical protein
MRNKLPDKIREEQSRAGKARMALLTPDERVALARHAWEMRVKKAKAAELEVMAARSLP